MSDSTPPTTLRPRRRNILLITTDQQRYDALGCNGGAVARTPCLDGLAAAGINYRRAMNQNVVCMPARASILTGQYPSTHGVVANGVPLPPDAPSVAAHLHDHGYRTALLGKAHFEPAFDLRRRWFENRMVTDDTTGPYRGFDHLELAMHTAVPRWWHYEDWLHRTHPDEVDGFVTLFGPGGMNQEAGGDTGAPEVAHNAVAREHYHTDWVADRTMAFLDTVASDEPWFVWMSFPDPHHPWDPPASELGRVPWRQLDLPPAHPGSDEACRKVLAGKPAHWLGYYDGTFSNLEGGPPRFVPAQLTHDQLREVNAMTHIENELIDEACERVLSHIAAKGWSHRTDVLYTTDHGELQGDFGLLFKGPYHCEALMHIPLIWRPAPDADVAPAEISAPVGQVDIAPTLCGIAGVPVPDWVQGSALPVDPLDGDGEGSGRERVLTEWDSQFGHIGMHLRSMWRDDWLVTAYLPSSGDHPGSTEMSEVAAQLGGAVLDATVRYDGTEGELYNLADDPYQWHNLWDDPTARSTRDDLVADLGEHLPPVRNPLLAVEAPT
ncbi:MAG: sulfatase-like hydrolase/transferase [Acidimicrobiia bacterium]|nr:sulfatase-like hydrolase/transferase [Acidimicrobiia bacterium]